MLDALADLFCAAGHVVHGFSSAEDLLRSDDFWHFDCLISEISMPAMSGVDLGEKVKLTRPKLPIFFITDSNVLADLVRSLDDAPRLFLKHLNANKLINAVKVAISERRRPAV